MRLLPLLLLAACSPVPDGPCGAELVEPASVELGQIVGVDYAPLGDGDELMVHAGLEGGFHSDIAVRLRGPGADELHVDALTLRATLREGWGEEQVETLVPECRDMDGELLVHVFRFRYWGPGCGEDPCAGPDDDEPACQDYRACVAEEEAGYPNVSWDELIDYVADFDLTVGDGDFVGSDAASGIDLVRGFQVGGGG